MSDDIQERGIGYFFLAAIPFVLGLAAIVWFSVWITGHNFNRQVTEEHRAADAVGEKVLPKGPMKITIRNNPRECVKVEDVHFEGDDLWVYSRRTCGNAGSYVELHWREITADGTVVKTGYTNHDFNDMDTGQRTEYKPYGFEVDPRAVELVISITGNV